MRRAARPAQTLAGRSRRGHRASTHGDRDADGDRLERSPRSARRRRVLPPAGPLAIAWSQAGALELAQREILRFELCGARPCIDNAKTVPPNANVPKIVRAPVHLGAVVAVAQQQVPTLIGTEGSGPAAGVDRGRYGSHRCWTFRVDRKNDQRASDHFVASRNWDPLYPIPSPRGGRTSFVHTRRDQLDRSGERGATPPERNGASQG